MQRTRHTLAAPSVVKHLQWTCGFVAVSCLNCSSWWMMMLKICCGAQSVIWILHHGRCMHNRHCRKQLLKKLTNSTSVSVFVRIRTRKDKNTKTQTTKVGWTETHFRFCFCRARKDWPKESVRKYMSVILSCTWPWWWILAGSYRKNIHQFWGPSSDTSLPHQQMSQFCKPGKRFGWSFIFFISFFFWQRYTCICTCTFRDSKVDLHCVCICSSASETYTWRSSFPELIP